MLRDDGQVCADIDRYLATEKRIESDFVRKMAMDKVLKHDDIAREFVRWLKERTYTNEVSVENYTSRDIYDMAPFLDGIGVYNFLATLRDNPQAAKRIIKNEFVIRSAEK